ncbi:hypothetical protein [Streptomyces sp. NPDC014734]|uniref:hypothetical protein n=1 Tax=Streptomyces sp. NPDC014734 TaxID=3364886 RepID=UPI0036F6A6ED
MSAVSPAPSISGPSMTAPNAMLAQNAAAHGAGGATRAPAGTWKLGVNAVRNVRRATGFTGRARVVALMPLETGTGRSMSLVEL